MDIIDDIGRKRIFELNNSSDWYTVAARLKQSSEGDERITYIAACFMRSFSNISPIFNPDAINSFSASETFPISNSENHTVFPTDVSYPFFYAICTHLIYLICCDTIGIIFYLAISYSNIASKVLSLEIWSMINVGLFSSLYRQKNGIWCIRSSIHQVCNHFFFFFILRGWINISRTFSQH